MSNAFFEKPILNSPYTEPSEHWEFTPEGQPTGNPIGKRRKAEFFTPIPKSRKRSKKNESQATLEFQDDLGLSTDKQAYQTNDTIMAIRKLVGEWRLLPESRWNVTPTTQRLLKWWRKDDWPGRRPFFCQVEAVEVMIWLTEVAPGTSTGKRLLEELEGRSRAANPDLFRLCLKLATGAGKTTVMAMLIAWHTLNAVRSPTSKRFTRGFLLVAPGITIRDRLRVLMPNDPENYYRSFQMIPHDLMEDMQKARIVITNYHAFKLRERLGLAKGTREFLRGRGDDIDTLETEGQMIQRVMPDLMGLKNILVINDEAHHCYREKPADEADEEATTIDDLKGAEKKEAKEESEAARMWITGLETIQRKLGISRVVDLSATPFFLRGSGYIEGTIFGWTCSDFSLMDAIECGIVKLPRVPVADNIPGAEVPVFRDLWENIRKDMPKKSRGTSELDPLSLPTKLQTALTALYGHYEETHRLWEKAGITVPPCFIIVCNNTSTSKLIYDYISGFRREGNGEFVEGRFDLFWNYDKHGEPYSKPNTLLIDSKQLESGDALDASFLEAAGDEIERFKYEIRQRNSSSKTGPDADNLSEADILREVMNTVGEKGKLGESIRCVVSVSMLTEGWDCLDEQTEILTVNGWKFNHEVKTGEQMYALNRETGMMDIVPILEHFERPVKPGEQMVTLKSQHHDIRVTEGHEFHIKYRDPRRGGILSSNFITKKAKELLTRKSSYAIPLSADLAEHRKPLPLTDDEIKLIAWFMTDGGFSSTNLTIHQSKDYKFEIRELLNRLQFDYTETVLEPYEGQFANAQNSHRFRIPKGTHGGTLSRSGWSAYEDYLDKDVAEVLHQMDRRQFWLFWQELLKGDGEQHRGNKSGYLWCDRKSQVDAYMTMAVTRGFAANYSERITANGKTVYRVGVRDTQFMTTDPNDARSANMMAERPRSGEKVWCVRNRNSTIVTRRNGKVAIIGNCNTVTHILGVRAFGTQLLCEQVVGRALRRRNYELNEEGLFDVEYADILGIPFNFASEAVQVTPKPPVERLHVKAVRPDRDKLEIVFPRVQGYRTELLPDKLVADFEDDHSMRLTPDDIGATMTLLSGIVGEQQNLTLEHTKDMRQSTIIMHLTTRLMMTKFRDANNDPQLHLFGTLKPIVKRWLDTHLECVGGTYPAQLMYQELADKACERINDAINRSAGGDSYIRAVLDPYNPRGTSHFVNFHTTKDAWATREDKSPVNYAVLDSGWEGEFCRVVENHPRVLRYVKNQGLGLEVPYLSGGQQKNYVPDFIVLIDDGHGPDDPLQLIVEVKGYRREDVKDKSNTMKTYWVPGVNKLKAYGRWAFAEFRDVYLMEADFEEKITAEVERIMTEQLGAAAGAVKS